MRSDVAASLTRKLGPLPVWTWALIGGVALYWWRQRHSSRSGGGAPVDTQALAQQQYQQQTPQVLAPGESVYDPNTGVLTSANGNNGNSLAPSIIGLIAALLMPKPAGRHPHRHGTHRHRHPPHHRNHHHHHPTHHQHHREKSHSHPKHGAGSRRK